MRLVLDTNVIVSAFLWNGKSAELLEALLAAEADLFSSQPLLDELLATLEKDKLASKVDASGLNPAQWVEHYAGLCTITAMAPLRPIAPDPDDDRVIATAIAAEADLIVTGDKPFLGVGVVDSERIVTVSAAMETVVRG